MNVLVLCHANRWRSPLAAGIIQRECDKRALVVTVVQAGFKEAGLPAGRPVRDAALELGFSLENHRSKVLSYQMLHDADFIVFMDGGNLRRLQKAIEFGAKHRDWEGRLLALGSYCQPARTRIEDLAFISPRTQPVDFDRVVRYIDQACRTLVDTVIAPAAT